MKVWKWGCDSDRYDSFIFPNTREFYEYFEPYFDGTVIGDKWGSVQFETEHKLKITDCTGIGSNFPIFSERAVQMLSSYLETNVEVLPLQHPSESFYAINVTRVIDGLDYENSIVEYVEGHPNVVRRVLRFAFKLDIIREYPIFKIPVHKRLRVFVTDAFKNAVEANGLKGFTFELLWDSEDSGDKEAELEQRFQEKLAALERNKGEEFSFQEAERRISDGEGCASGKWRLQKAHDGTVRLGNLQWDGSYNWIQPVFYPPILLDLKWHKVDTLPID